MRASDRASLFTASTWMLRLFLQSACLALGAALAIAGYVSAGTIVAGAIIIMGLEGICRNGLQVATGAGQRTWLKAKNMSEGEFTLLGSEINREEKPFVHLARWDGVTSIGAKSQIFGIPS